MIWFSCFCWASENFRSIPSFWAVSWMLLVFAVRHPLSAPTWAKPIAILPLPLPLLPLSSPEPELPQAVSEMVPKVIAHAATRLFFSTVFPLGWSGSCPGVTGVT